MRVIGTAGHVDHGKSTLVHALTGEHPDRLKEEREREMTIDLGFAWMTLPDGEEVGIIDVPGHRDFIENMLSGVGGIDAALFVVAADEGVMPQTREHLAILDLLKIQGGIVVITKTDLVDEEWLELVEDDLNSVLYGTVMQDAPIVRTSSVLNTGLKTLKDELSKILQEHPLRPNLSRPRLPIDRVFTIAGFGTVVTGTLSDGIFKVGDEIQILPHGLSGRIRGLQTHKQKEIEAIPGSRTAINISGISNDQIKRGDVVVHPKTYNTSRRLDVQFDLLAQASTHLKHDMEAKLFLGSTETSSRIRLLGTKELEPGESGWLQLETSIPVTAVRGDRFILRRPSPPETIGGGKILDSNPRGRYKRFSIKTMDRLKTITNGSTEDILYETIQLTRVAKFSELLVKSNLEHDVAIHALYKLLDDNRVILLNRSGISNMEPSIKITDDTVSIVNDSLIISAEYWSRTIERVLNTLRDYHNTYPLRRGMQREEFRSRTLANFNNNSKVYESVMHELINRREILELGPMLAIKGHDINFSPEQQNQVNSLLRKFKLDSYSPPSVKDCINFIGEELFFALLATDVLVTVSKDVVFQKETYDKMVLIVKELLIEQETITAAQVRDHFNTSRKYSLALLEHLDSIGVTVREGDFRKLRG